MKLDDKFVELRAALKLWESASIDEINAASELGDMKPNFAGSPNAVAVHCLLTMRLIREVQKIKDYLGK